LTPADAILQAQHWLHQASRITVLAGAGLSAESGVPTFRGPDGLWNNFKAEDLATPQAFARDPQLVWQWYDWRRQLIAACRPNLGHYALADLEKQAGDGFTLVTQNVDGLHNRAGSERVVKIHGDIWWTLCTGCNRIRTDLRVPLPEIPPTCDCGALLRPAIVWFGESLPTATWRQAEQAALNCDVMIVAGTSAVVYPAASLAPLAQRAGAKLIEINTEDTPLSGIADLALRGPSGEILPQLVDA